MRRIFTCNNRLSKQCLLLGGGSQLSSHLTDFVTNQCPLRLNSTTSGFPDVNGGIAPRIAVRGRQGPQTAAPKPKDSQFLTVTVDDKTKIATLSVKRRPVNSLSLELMEDLNAWLAYIADSDEIKALILTSGVPHVFSAGLELTELYQCTEEFFTKFWFNFQEVFLKLNTLPKPTVAAVNGFAPAGGCILAISCDYRVMASHIPYLRGMPYTIGLIETKFGLLPPVWTVPLFTHVVGSRLGEKLMMNGDAPTAAEALTIGLVDEVTSLQNVKTRATEAAKRLSAGQTAAKCATRDFVRTDALDILSDETRRKEDLEFVVRTIRSDTVQTALGAYLEKMKKGDKKKKSMLSMATKIFPPRQKKY